MALGDVALERPAVQAGVRHLFSAGDDERSTLRGRLVDGEFVLAIASDGFIEGCLVRVGDEINVLPVGDGFL